MPNDDMPKPDDMLIITPVLGMLFWAFLIGHYQFRHGIIGHHSKNALLGIALLGILLKMHYWAWHYWAS